MPFFGLREEIGVAREEPLKAQGQENKEEKKFNPYLKGTSQTWSLTGNYKSSSYIIHIEGKTEMSTRLQQQILGAQ